MNADELLYAFRAICESSPVEPLRSPETLVAAGKLLDAWAKAGYPGAVRHRCCLRCGDLRQHDLDQETGVCATCSAERVAEEVEEAGATPKPGSATPPTPDWGWMPDSQEWCVIDVNVGLLFVSWMTFPGEPDEPGQWHVGGDGLQSRRVDSEEEGLRIAQQFRETRC